MFLQKLTLTNFKSYKLLELDLHPNLNCFVGNNGQGKTNLLDAIYYLSMCKSSLNAIDYNNIHHSEDFFVIQGHYDRESQSEQLFCSVQRSSAKIFKRNGKEYQRLADHIGFIPVVIVSPADSSLIVEGSEERRKFLNTVISQYDRSYLEKLMRYNKLLANRNRLLKDLKLGASVPYDLLEVVDEQMDSLATPIFEKRQEFTQLLTPYFQRYYSEVSGGKEEVSLNYMSHLHEEPMKELLAGSFEKDRALQFTTRGIHKDDISFQFNGHPLKREGSQGQQKTYLIALRLAQFSYMAGILPVKPILLLDDIFDKLDAVRVQQFIALVAHNGFGQIFITDANKNRLDSILSQIETGYALYSVDGGEVAMVKTQ